MSSGPVLTGTLTGYAATDDYVAQMSVQGNRKHYVIVLPLPQVITTLPIPDPSVPFDDNREVSPNHAKSFATYVRTNKNWHAGCLTIRTRSDATSFKPFEGGQIGALAFGMLSVPRNARGIFKIIDGQHRILGIKYLLDSLDEDLMTAVSSFSKAERINAEKAVIEQFEREIKNIKSIKKRVESDCIAIELVIEDDTELAKQIFVDVANHALGVRKAITAKFDQSKVVNRALNALLDDPGVDDLIRDRIDGQKDRVTGANPNLMGAGSLADIIRIITVGINGRVSSAQEKTLDQAKLAKETNRFFEVLRVSFPELNAIAIGADTTASLRKTSILASSTMLRVLSGVYFDLKEKGVSITEIIEYFTKLSNHTAAPIKSSDPSGKMWMDATTEGAFVEGANAPGSRAQAVKALVSAIVNWYTTPPVQMN
jgi:hypothetical protein